MILLAKSYNVIGSTALSHYWQVITLLALIHLNDYIIGRYSVIGRCYGVVCYRVQLPSSGRVDTP